MTANSLLLSVNTRFWAYVIVAALISWLGISRAYAADTSGQCPVSAPCSRPVAYQKCDELIQYQISIGYYTDPSRHRCRLASTGINYTHDIYDSGWQYGFGGDVFYFTDCSFDKPWVDSTHTCGSPCSDAPNLGPSAISGAASGMCSNGCAYRQKVDPSGDFSGACLGSGASQFCAAKGWEPTGETCQQDQFPAAEPYDPNKPVCSTSAGGYTECVHPDGRHCITAVSGRRLCYNLSDTGYRYTADGKLGADRQMAPGQNTPPSKLVDPHPVSSSATTINNTTYNTTTYEGSGTVPGQSNPGESGNDDGPGGEQDGDKNGMLGKIKASIDKIGDWLTGLGSEAGGLDNSPGDDLDADSAWVEDDDSGDLDASGYGWGRSCPPPPSISVPGGGQLDFTLLCSAASMFGALILAAGYVQAAFIIGRS